MKRFNRYRRVLSAFSLFAFVFGLGLSATPAQAHYNPKLGRFLQRDANGTALVLSPGHSQQAMNPTVTVSMAYELQFGDGMNFYEYLKSTPPNQRDPSGLFTLGGQLGAATIRSELNNLQLSGGRSLIDGLKGVAFFANQRNAILDQLLGNISDPFDFSGIDSAFAAFDTAKLATFGFAAGILSGKLLISGTKVFKRFVKRAGGRKGLLNILSSGTKRVKRFFGFRTSRRSFSSFPALKRSLGSAGKNRQWHHIVEQSKIGQFGTEAINNTDNVIAIPKELNQRLNGYYSSKKRFSEGLTVRKWLEGKTFQEQYDFGIKKLKDFGWQ